jgi:hypothetical protein
MAAKIAAMMPVTEAETVLEAPAVKWGTVLEEVLEAPVPVAPAGVVAEPGVPVAAGVPEAAPGVPVAVDVPIESGQFELFEEGKKRGSDGMRVGSTC